MKSGRTLIPAVWFSRTQLTQTELGPAIVIEQEALDLVAVNGVAQAGPQPAADFGCRTRYLLTPGAITREDRFFCRRPQTIRLSLRCATFAGAGRTLPFDDAFIADYPPGELR